MKYAFLGALLAMSLLSVAAWLWQPRPVDARAVQLAFFLQEADRNADGKVAREELWLWFLSLDADGDGCFSSDDVAANGLGDTRGSGPSAAFVKPLLEFSDDNGDDKVSQAELSLTFRYLDRTRDHILSPEDHPVAPPVELVWCSDDNPVRREQTRLFNRLHPDYLLRLDPQNSTMEKVIVQSLAGVGPDIFDCYNGYQLSSYVRTGIAMDITDVMAASGHSAEEFWPSLYPYIIYDGRQYGAINNAGAQAVWYNKRIFREAGLPYPTSDWTWDECIELCKKLTLRNPRGQIVRYGLIAFWWDWKLAVFQHGADFFTPEGTRCALDSPEAAAGMQFMQDLLYKHEVMPTPQAEAAIASTGGWGAGAISLFGAERGAMAIGGRWWLCTLRNKDYANIELGAVEIPALRLADGSLSRRIYAYGRSSQVNATGKNIEGALAFVRFLCSPEWSDLINRQADAMGPVVRYNYTDTFLHNPEYPEEDYNAVWRSAMENSVPDPASPFVNGQTVDRILAKQTDLVRVNQKSGADAMRDAAKKINEAIIETLARDPALRRQYYEALARGARPAWEDEATLPWRDAP